MTVDKAGNRDFRSCREFVREVLGDTRTPKEFRFNAPQIITLAASGYSPEQIQRIFKRKSPQWLDAMRKVVAAVQSGRHIERPASAEAVKTALIEAARQLHHN